MRALGLDLLGEQRLNRRPVGVERSLQVDIRPAGQVIDRAGAVHHQVMRFECQLAQAESVGLTIVAPLAVEHAAGKADFRAVVAHSLCVANLEAKPEIPELVFAGGSKQGVHPATPGRIFGRHPTAQRREIAARGEIELSSPHRLQSAGAQLLGSGDPRLVLGRWTRRSGKRRDYELVVRGIIATFAFPANRLIRSDARAPFRRPNQAQREPVGRPRLPAKSAESSASSRRAIGEASGSRRPDKDGRAAARAGCADSVTFVSPLEP